jgi:hypothetical protein
MTIRSPLPTAVTTLALLVAICAACTGATTAVDPASPDGTGPDGTSPDGTSPDGGTKATTPDGGTTTPPVTTGPCPSFYGPVVVGSRWQWYGSYTTNGSTYTTTSTSTITRVEKSGDAVLFESRGVIDGTTSGTVNGTSASTTTSRLRCDATGVHLLSMDTDGTYVFNGNTTKTASKTVYEGDGYLTVPASLKVGDSWAGKVRGNTTVGSTVTAFEFTSAATVKASPPVTVKAGTFAVVEVATTTTPAQGTPTTTSSWMSDGVGSVKSGNSELVSKNF